MANVASAPRPVLPPWVAAAVTAPIPAGMSTRPDLWALADNRLLVLEVAVTGDTVASQAAVAARKQLIHRPLIKHLSTSQVHFAVVGLCSRGIVGPAALPILRDALAFLCGLDHPAPLKLARSALRACSAQCTEHALTLVRMHQASQRPTL